jgi:hypothetical protein
LVISALPHRHADFLLHHAVPRLWAAVMVLALVVQVPRVVRAQVTISFWAPVQASLLVRASLAVVTALLAMLVVRPAQVVPSSRVQLSREVAQVLKEERLLPVEPVSLQAYPGRRHCGPFVSGNRRYFDWRHFGPHECS